jgi:class II flagellar assembly regulator FliX
MKIQGFVPVSGTRGVGSKKKARSGSSDFEALIDDGALGVGTSPQASGINLTNVLLSLQEADDDNSRRKEKSTKNAKQMLSYLSDLRDSILMGSVSKGRLEELDKLVKEQRERFEDDRLNSILDDVEIRASVELAKLEKVK